MATDPIVDTRVAPRRRSISHDEYKCPYSEVLPGWMVVAIGPGSHAESFIWAATLCARRAGRSAEDRLLCKQEVLGSNPSRSTPIPYLPRFKSTLRTLLDLGLESSARPCASYGTGLLSHGVGSAGTRASTS